MKYTDCLMHYNHNHDKLGRFARSIGSAGGKVGSSVTSSGKKKKKNQPPKADIKKGKAANTKLSDKERKRIVESGDAKEVARNKDRLSTRELETAVNRLEREKVQRIDLEKKLSDLNTDGKQKKTALEKIEKYGNDLERLSNAAEKAAKMYNTAAKTHNLIAPASEQWPIYGEAKKKGKNKTDQEKDWEARGNKVKEQNLRNKEAKAERERQEEEFNLRKLQDQEASYDGKQNKENDDSKESTNDDADRSNRTEFADDYKKKKRKG